VIQEPKVTSLEQERKDRDSEAALLSPMDLLDEVLDLFRRAERGEAIE
jgi:hypothetical protein